MARFTQPERELIMRSLPATVAQLAEITGLSEQKVRHHLRVLEAQRAAQVVDVLPRRKRVYGWYTGVPFVAPPKVVVVVVRRSKYTMTWAGQVLL